MNPRRRRPDQPKTLYEIISRLAGRDRKKLRDSLRLDEDLGLSSLERIDLLSWIEVRYELRLDETEFSAISTIGDLKSWIQEARGRTTPGPEAGRAVGPPPERPAQARVAPPRWTRGFPMRWFRNSVQALLIRPVFGHYIDFEIQGLENLDAVSSPVIFAANHASHLDTVAIATGLPSPWRGKLAPAMMQERFAPDFAHSGSLTNRLSLGGQYYLACSLFNALPASTTPRPGAGLPALHRGTARSRLLSPGLSRGKTTPPTAPPNHSGKGSA